MLHEKSSNCKIWSLHSAVVSLVSRFEASDPLTSKTSRKTSIHKVDAVNIFNTKGYIYIFCYLMFFWPCIMNWLYINYQLWCTDYYLFKKYCSPLHVSSLTCSSSGGYSCTNAAYGTVTLYESSWWPVGTQLEWKLTVGGRLLVGVLRHMQHMILSFSMRVPGGLSVHSLSENWL